MGNLISLILASNEFQVLIKLVVVTILSCIIGYERENKSKPAGFRTHALVGIGACLVMICATGISDHFGNNDPSRMPAQLLSGIGFIGAGTILRDGFTVTGLTTAAGLLAVTVIGLCVGEGLYIEAIIGTVVVYVMLTYSYKLFSKGNRVDIHNLKINMYHPKEKSNDLVNVFNEFKLEVDELIKELEFNQKESNNNELTGLTFVITGSIYDYLEYVEEKKHSYNR